MNKVWRERRTKQGLAARQFKACERKLRRLRTAKAPLPHVAVSRGPHLTLTVSVGLPEQPDPPFRRHEYDLEEEW